VAFVQTNNSGTGRTASTVGIAFPGAQTAGNLNVVVISFGSSSSNAIANLISSVVDTLGNIYTPSNSWLSGAGGSTSSLGQIIYSAPNILAAGAGVNIVDVNLSATVSFLTIAVAEYSGLALSSPVNVTSSAKADSPSPSTASTGSLTTTIASDTLFGAVAFFDGANASPALTAGFTQRAKYYTEFIADQAGAPTGSYSMSAVSAGTGGWVAQLVAFKPPGAAGLSFPMAIADTSTITRLAFEIERHFALTAADTSSVTALGFRTGLRFGLTAADTSTVTALGFRVGQRFPLGIADTSTVTALGFHIAGVLHFAMAIADTSTVTALSFRVTRRFALSIADTSSVTALSFQNNLPVILHFPLVIADTSTVTALGFRVTRRFALAAADSSTVTRLMWSLPVQHFPFRIADISVVLALGFENDLHLAPVQPLTVGPYAGQNQQSRIAITAESAYRQVWEEGPWVMPPYAQIFPPPVQAPGLAIVPPPIRASDLWSAMQTWPL
jgi:hypothetical protein